MNVVGLFDLNGKMAAVTIGAVGPGNFCSVEEGIHRECIVICINLIGLKASSAYYELELVNK